MEITRESDSELVLREPPEGLLLGLTWVLVGVLFLLGLAYVAAEIGGETFLNYRQQGGFDLEEHGLLLLFPLLFVIFMYALYARYRACITETTTRLKAGYDGVVREVRVGGRLKRRATHTVTDETLVVGTRQQTFAKTATEGLEKVSLYTATLRTPGFEPLEIAKGLDEAVVLWCSLLLTDHLKVPTRIEWATPEYRAGCIEATDPVFESFDYLVFEDAQRLEISSKSGLHRLSSDALRFLPIPAIGTVMMLYLAVTEGMRFHYYAAAAFAALGVASLAWFYKGANKAERISFVDGRLLWSKNDEPVVEVRLEELLELANLKSGLYLFFRNGHRGLLTGQETRDEQAGLYRLLDRAVQANGLPPFEGAFGSRLLTYDDNSSPIPTS